MEKWLPVQGYDGFYEVSDMGRIRSFKQCKEGKIMKIKRMRDTYLYINLTKEGKCKTLSLHRIIAQTFIENPENKPCINYIDGCKENNAVSNLQWSTYKENNKHALEKNLRAYGAKRVVLTRLIDGEKLTFPSMTKASLFLGHNRRFVTWCTQLGKNIIQGYKVEVVS